MRKMSILRHFSEDGTKYRQNTTEEGGARWGRTKEGKGYIDEGYIDGWRAGWESGMGKRQVEVRREGEEVYVYSTSPVAPE